MSFADVIKKYSFIKGLEDLPISFIFANGYEEEFIKFVVDKLEAEVRENLEGSRRYIAKEKSNELG